MLGSKRPGSVSSTRSARPARSLLCRALVLVGLLATQLAAPAAFGQEFGQWWWEGSAGVAQRSNESRSGDEVLMSSDTQDLRLRLGLNGFLLHPALGSFRLGVDLLVSQLESGETVNTDRSGLDLDLSVLPRSSYPIRLFFRRRAFDYTRETDGQTLPVFRSPDVSTQLGGRARLRRGPLRGTLVGVDRTTLSFQDQDVDDEGESRVFVDWGRQIGRLRHRVRLERHLQELSLTGLDLDDVSLSFDQDGTLGSTWGWHLSGSSLLREADLDGAERFATDSHQVRNRLFRKMRDDRDLLDIQTTVDVVRNRDAEGAEAVGLSAFYRWRPRRGLEIAPFTQLARQSSGALDLLSPRIGVSASRTRTEGRLDSVLSSQVSFGSTRVTGAGQDRTETLISLAFSGSLGHGTRRGLRKELEVELAKDELDLSRDPVRGLPDLGLGGRNLGNRDLGRVRVSLGHQWRRTALDGWGEWSRRKSSGDDDINGLDNETLSSSLQLGWGNLHLLGSLGETQIRQGELPEQSIRFDSLSLRWRLWRAVALRSAYRSEDRTVTFGPDGMRERLEVGVDIRVGQTVLEGTYFESQERLNGGPLRDDEGFTWSVTRSFSGWLPVVTGSQRRGVIR